MQPKICAAKKKRQVGYMTSVERGSFITVISYMSAGGTFSLPFWWFHMKKPYQLLMKHSPLGSDSACHISGWIQIPVFTSWFNNFLRFTNPYYYSHTDCTLIMQSLDKAFMGRLKIYYNDEIRRLKWLNLMLLRSF